MATSSALALHAKRNAKKTLIDWRDQIFSIYERIQLKDSSYLIISNNCWGYELYGSTGCEYNTPFIGLFMMPECYLQLLENFETYINSELTFLPKSKYHEQPRAYPVGTLGNGLEIHFLHYASESEAKQKWNCRMLRLKTAMASKISIFVKMCDCEGCSLEHLERFHALPFNNKLSIGLLKINHPSHLYVPCLRHSLTGKLIDGAKLFKKRYAYFDITHWILTGEIRKTPLSRIFSIIS